MTTAVLSNADHPEFGVVTIPLPIPREQYDHCVSMLEALEIGDASVADCRLDDLWEAWPVLNCLQGTKVNLDELDYVSILFLGVIALLLTLTNSIQYVASLSLFADLFFYVIGIISAAGMRKKYPDLHRPYKAPGLWIGVPVSAVIYIVMMTQLGLSAIISGVVWAICGMALYFGYRKYKGASSDEESLSFTNSMEEPSAEEKSHMDQEYRVWRGIVVGAIILAVALYVIPYMIV